MSIVAEAIDLCGLATRRIVLLGSWTSLGRFHIFGKAAYRAFFAVGSRVCPELHVLYLQDQAIAM